MVFDYRHLQSDLEQAIRRGETGAAKQKIRSVPLRKAPREELARLANLSRRAGLPLLSVRLLNALVRPSGRKPRTATESEKAEYAASISSLGAPEEALALLTTLNPQACPEAGLYRAFALVSLSDYPATIPLLETFLKTPKLDPYQRLVASANLVAALLEQRRHAEAEPLLLRLKKVVQKEGYWLLYGSLIELSLRDALDQKNWEGLARNLDEMKALGARGGTLNQFFAKKWICFEELERHGFSRPARELLGSLRDEARRLQQWETLRDCDRREARLNNDERLYTHLYFGTRSPAYKEALLTECQSKHLTLPNDYVMTWGGTPPPEKILDLCWGTVANEKSVIKAGQVVHRTLLALASDFYRPIRLATLHHQIFPKEYFNPVSAPERVHRALFRLRSWAAQRRVPLKIVESGSQYRLEARHAWGLIFSHRGVLQTPEAVLAGRLRETFGTVPFSGRAALGAIGGARSRFLELLASAVSQGLVTAIGRGRATRYVLK